MLYTAQSAQFYSVFSPTTISSTLRFCRKREVWLRFFAKNARNDLKTHSYKDSAKCNSAFLATMLSHALHFWQKRRVIENYEYLGEFEEYFRKRWLYCVLYLLVTETCKKKLKNRLWKSRACVPFSLNRNMVKTYRRRPMYTGGDGASDHGPYGGVQELRHQHSPPAQPQVRAGWCCVPVSRRTVD